MIDPPPIRPSADTPPLKKLTKPDKLKKHAYKFSMNKTPPFSRYALIKKLMKPDMPRAPSFYRINPIHGILETLEYYMKVLQNIL